ncbi:bifunctional DNA primase/polymerase [Streptomyces lonarensis]|uniref:Bifunctional DNA primase/polymerase n=1 Tax=Streptomyces lonarensis TaxID=700599 RepID=A0A7X6CZQ6_9ACTN|nr:bifunctional DNA primase/polymerase [Streptomyces lonarensis]NJQ05497.1 bifunctional DNA primase/polymerase [Streptomyces lonarensis]
MTPSPCPPLLAAALECANRGWPVFPLRPGSKRPTGHPAGTCPRTGRCAAGHRTPEQRATTDPELIGRAWATVPYGIGLATGPAGLVVVDLDKPKTPDKRDAPCGAATFKALCERAGQPVPTTRAVRTAGGGRHLYFTAPPGSRLHNTQGRLGPLVDTRAWGGYVLAPGTTLPAGRYELVDAAPVAPLPNWLLALLALPVRRTVASAPVPGRAPAYVAAAFRSETDAVATAPEGARNAALTRAARALGRFVAAGQLTRSEVEGALNGAGQHAGLTPSETRATVTSALNWSIANNPVAAVVNG